MAGLQAAQVSNGDFMETIKLSAKNIYLKPVSDEDLSYLYSKECDLSEKHLWSDNRTIPISFEYKDEFWDRLKHFYHVFFMIYSKQNRCPIGFVYSYQLNQNDKVCYMTIYIEKDYRKSFVSAVAGTLFCDYLFSFYDLRKIYALVYDYNTASKDFLLHAGFVEEGRLKEHRYYSGKYYDMITLALYRTIFYTKMKKLLYNIKKEVNDL